MDTHNSILHIITTDLSAAEKLSTLFKTVKIVVNIYKNPRSFIMNNEQNFSGCVLIDSTFPEENCHEALIELKQNNISLPIIVTTNNDDIRGAINAMKLGVIDFILKPISDQALIEAIQKYMNKIRAKPYKIHNKILQLSKRERQIMDQIMDGKLNKQIAYALSISISTVEQHRRNIMAKMEAKNMAQLIGFYYLAQLNEKNQLSL